MNNEDKVKQINYLFSEVEALYHQASLKLGISDSVSIVLYTIYGSGNECLLSDIYKNSGISKQTVNSAIRNLEAKNIVFLKPYNGRSKMVALTEEGKEYAKETVAKLYEAEANAFESFSQEEIETYMHLTKKYTECLKLQIEKF